MGKSVKVSWTEGEDAGAVVFTDDGADKATSKAAAYIRDSLARATVDNVKTEPVTLDEEGRVKPSKSSGGSSGRTAKS